MLLEAGRKVLPTACAVVYTTPPAEHRRVEISEQTNELSGSRTREAPTVGKLMKGCWCGVDGHNQEPNKRSCFDHRCHLAHKINHKLREICGNAISYLPYKPLLQCLRARHVGEFEADEAGVFEEQLKVCLCQWSQHSLRLG